MKQNLIFSFVIIFGLIGCGSDSHKPVLNKKNPSENLTAIDTLKVTEEIVQVEPKTPEISVLEQKIIKQGLSPVPDSLQNVLLDLKYATDDNFMKFQLYEGMSNAYLQPSVMARFAKVASYLDENFPHLRLLIYDAVRPRSVQQMMWDSLSYMPVNERIKFVSNPKNGSLHNYGCALDLTLADSTGAPLDMGAGYDDSRKIAYPRLENQFLESGELTQEQVDNRKLLRKVMKKGGFWNIQTEWWHFNAMRRADAQQQFEIVE